MTTLMMIFFIVFFSTIFTSLISWVEVPFLYKPTSIYQPLPMVAPFQPRLDWQMWFAALSSYEREPCVYF
jgi:hypothetical protein